MCYLLFFDIVFFLLNTNYGMQLELITQSYNPVYAKVIVNSIVDLFNGISINAGKMPGDYIYMLTTSSFIHN